MHKVIISLLLLAVFSACNAATAETNRNYDYRAQSSETRKLLTRQQEINRELYRGEITRGEAAALKFRARQNHLNAINVIRSQRYAEERQPFIQPQQLQQRYKLTPEALESVENPAPSTRPGTPVLNEKGFYLSESARGEGKVCFYNVLWGIRGYNTSSGSACPTTMEFTAR